MDDKKEVARPSLITRFSLSQFTQDAQRGARFERGAQLLASLSHPNIAAVYSFEHADALHFLVRSWWQGRPWRRGWREVHFRSREPWACVVRLLTRRGAFTGT